MNAHVFIYFYIQVYKHIQIDPQKNRHMYVYTLRKHPAPLGGIYSAYTALGFWHAVKELCNILISVTHFQDNLESNSKTLIEKYI